MALFREARKYSLDKAAGLHPQLALVLTVLPAAKGWQMDSKGQVTAKKAVTALTSRLRPERCRHTALSPQPAGRGD